MKNPYKVIEGKGIIPEGTEIIVPEAFKDCKGMTELVIPDSVTEIGEKAFMDCGELTHLVIPDSVKTIGSFAFGFCWKLKSIVLPNSIKELEKGAFFGTGISEIVIPDSVEKIGTHCFTRCPELTSISVSKGNAYYDSRDNCNAIIETATNTLIQGCNTTVIPDSVTKIGEEACSECRHLKQIIIPDSVTEIGSRAFCECVELIHIHISASTMKIGNEAFVWCGSNLSSITIDDGNKYYDSRENCNAIIETATNTLIQGCNSTVIPNSIKEIGDFAFWGCKHLENIVIPDSATTIGRLAFFGCCNLKSIVFSNSLVKIGDRAFEGCEKLNLPEAKIVRTRQPKTENLWRLATDCFETTSAGRRPWRIKDEITFHKKMVEGYELATKYISLSGDFSHFPDWFSILNPFRTDRLIVEVSNWINCNEDVQNLRWEHYSYKDVVAYLKDTLDKQLSLLWKWLDGDIEGFVNHWGAKRIEDLLELFVEDDVLFDVLRKLASLKHNQTVADILTFYAEYDLPWINSNALKLLEEYRL